jgi:hypothetical protein
MKKPTVIVFLASLVFILTLSGRNLQQNKKEAMPESVTGSGCVRAGVESGCIVLTDFSGGKARYSLYFPSGTKPSPDTAISFEGTKREVDACMQGQAVNVTSWTRLKRLCPKEPSPTKRK